MKIAYLMQAGVADIRRYPLSGPSLHVKYVCEELKNLGHQVRLIVMFGKDVWKTDDFVHLSKISIKRFDGVIFRLFESAIRRIQRVLHFPYLGLFESLRFAQACQQELAGFDILYERMGWMGYGGALISRRLRVPLILEVNGDHLREMEMLGVSPKGPQRRISIWIMEQAIKQDAFIVATGDGWRQKFIERWGVKPDKVAVVENGSGLVNILSRRQLQSFASLESSSTMTTVIYIGAFEPWHGIMILIRAAAKAMTQGHIIKLILIGSGSQYDIAKELVHDLGIEQQVSFTGHLSEHDYALLLAEADIGVSPYCGRVEFSGLKLLDYKAAGLAIIASGENGQPAVIEHGYTGWIVPPCDEEALCDAIIMLAGNLDLRRKMGRQARLDAENLHSWKHTASQLQDSFYQFLK